MQNGNSELLREPEARFSLPIRSTRAWLSIILLLAAALRLYGFGERPRLWEDELAFLEYALTGDPYGVAHEAPLYAWLQFAWMWWIHHPTPNMMRLLSVGFGVLGVACAFWLGRRIAGTRVGLLSAALLAVNPMSLYLSHEVRPYTLYVVTSVLLIGSFILAWDRDTARQWILYGLALIAGLMSHLLVSQVCIALGLSAVTATWIERAEPGRGRRFGRFALTSTSFGLLGISWLFFRARAPYSLTGAHTDGPVDFLYRSMLSLGGSDPKMVWPSAIVSLLAGLGIWVLWRRRALYAVLLVSVLVVSGLITWATMAPVSPAGWLGWQRYLTHLLVPFLILVATGSVWLAESAPQFVSSRVPNAAGLAILLLPIALVIPGSMTWLENPNRHAGVANLGVYANFIGTQETRVRGLLLFEELHKREKWLSHGPMRRRYAIQFARHDALPTFGISRHGTYAIRDRMSRGDVLPIPVAVDLEKPPENGPYVVFPPTLGCAGLMKTPARGIRKSTTLRQFRWGLICDLEFVPEHAMRPLPAGRSTH